MEKISSKVKLIIILNSLAVLLVAYKIANFVAKVGKDLFSWWIPSGKIFSYVHFWQFLTFFFLPLPFGFYLLILILYLFVAIFLIFKIIKRAYDFKYLLISIILLLAILGSFVITIGE